jgi:hypothetical protein
MKNRRTRVLVGILVAALALTGLLVGAVAADDEDSGGPHNAILARVAEILGIDQADVEDAFQQAVQEEREARIQQMEEARQARIDALIDEGVLTQEDVDAWEEWLESRPDNSDEMQEWFESRPDLGGEGLLGMPGFRGRMGPGRAMAPGRFSRMPGGFGGGCEGGWDCPAVAPETEG